MNRTAIEWTDTTWNPIRGCSRVSEGCRNCYAERIAARFSGPGQPYEGLANMTAAGPRWTGSVRLVESLMFEPHSWRKPRRVFVNSMSDLFHERLGLGEITQLLIVMASGKGRRHCYQVLTKRPDRMQRFFANPARLELIYAQWHSVSGEPAEVAGWPLPNLWLGVSVENRATAVERIPLLQQTPAAVRFLSIEPLLESLGALDLNGIDWVIVGGESGPGARPIHPNWVRSVRDQCVERGIPFFFKQWGEYWPDSRLFDTKTKWINKAQTWMTPGAAVLDFLGTRLEVGDHFDTAVYPATILHRIGKKAAGRELDAREWNEFPEVP